MQAKSGRIRVGFSTIVRQRQRPIETPGTRVASSKIATIAGHRARSSAATRVAISIAVGCLALAGPATSEELKNYGKEGGPIELVVGYQPYYTESWSGVIMRGKKFYEKYLPKGSTVEFQIGLQGAIIVNNLLAGKQHIGYMGDMPAIGSTTKQEVPDIRLVAVGG